MMPSKITGNPYNYLVSITMALLMGFYGCNPKDSPRAWAIHNVTLIDAKNGQRNSMSVRIEENKIVEVVDANAFKATNLTMVVDGNGKYLIPGLWDSHVHLTYNMNLTPAMFDLFLTNGITSVRDTGGEIDLVLPLKKAADNNPQNTPRVKITGPLLDGIPTVYNGASARTPKLGVGLATIDQAIKQVAELDEAGVDMIKVYEMLSPKVFDAILKKADSLGLPVTGHVPLSLDAVMAAQLGMRSMEHLRNLEMAFTANWDSLLMARRHALNQGINEAGGMLRAKIHAAQREYALQNPDEVRKAYVLDALEMNNVWQVPTLTIMTVASLRFFGTDAWKASFDRVPGLVGTGWRERLERYMQTPINEQQVAYANWMLQMVRTLKDSGVNLMAGTDTPIFFLTPGYSLHEELALLVKAGLTPLEALDTATLQPARYFQIENELGTIEQGKLADLVLLDANPLKNIRNTTHIQAVIKDGKLHDEKALDSIVQRLKNIK